MIAVQLLLSVIIVLYFIDVSIPITTITMTVGKLEKNYVTLTVSLEGCPSATACACNFKTAATTEDNSSTSSIPDQQIYGSITSPWASAHSALTADVKITGLSSGTPYTTTATCADAQPIGDGVISSLYSYTSEVDRPSKPEQLRVKQQDDNYQLSWNAPKLPGGNPNNITYYVSVWTTVDKNGNGGTIVDKDYKTNLTTYSTTAKFTSGERSRFEIKACQIMLVDSKELCSNSVRECFPGTCSIGSNIAYSLSLLILSFIIVHVFDHENIK